MVEKEKFALALDDIERRLKQNGLIYVYAAVYGSQNYNLENPTSDIDLKVIVIPTLNDIVSNNKPITEVWDFEWGQADIKDIRLMIENWQKQNTNFLEILFTSARSINPIYKDEVNELLAAKEDIVRIDEERHIRASLGMQEQKYHALKHRFPSKTEIIDKYGYDPKQLSHIIRLWDLTFKYINGQDYSTCIHPIDSIKKRIMEIKTAEIIYTPEEAEDIAKTYMELTKYLYNVYLEKKSHNSLEDRSTLEMSLASVRGMRALEEFKYNVIKKALKEELKNEN